VARGDEERQFQLSEERVKRGARVRERHLFQERGVGGILGEGRIPPDFQSWLQYMRLGTGLGKQNRRTFSIKNGG